MTFDATLFNTGISTRKLVSGLSVLIAVASVGILSTPPAQAKLLNGSVEIVDIQKNSNDTTRGVTSAVPNGAQQAITDGASSSPDNIAGPAQEEASRPIQVQLRPAQPVLATARTPNVGMKTPPPNSFPVNYSGRWQCITRVVDSAIESVAVGTELISEVSFVEIPDGRVIARWLQPGWTETQASALSWSSREAQTDRTSYYFGEGMNGSWASRSRDHFVQVGHDRLECKSYVDQYIDGRYLGRYRTVSILTRMDTLNNIALGKRKEN